MSLIVRRHNNVLSHQPARCSAATCSCSQILKWVSMLFKFYTSSVHCWLLTDLFFLYWALLIGCWESCVSLLCHAARLGSLKSSTTDIIVAPVAFLPVSTKHSWWTGAKHQCNQCEWFYNATKIFHWQCHCQNHCYINQWKGCFPTLPRAWHVHICLSPVHRYAKVLMLQESLQHFFSRNIAVLLFQHLNICSSTSLIA